MSPKKSKDNRTPKRRADQITPNSRRSKRRATGDGSSALPDTAVALSQEESFKLRNAAEFDDCNTEALSNVVEVKDEPGDTASRPINGTQVWATRHNAATTVLTNLRPSPATSSAYAVPGAAFTDASDRDSILDTLLSQSFNPEMTQYVVKQILQDAQDSAGRGNEFGIAYIEAQIERLQRKVTSPSRLAEVVQLFQRGLRDVSNKFHSRISSVGGQTVRLESPEQKAELIVTGTHQSGHHVPQHRDETPRQSSPRLRASPFGIASVSQRLAAFEATHGQSGSSISSSEDEENIPSKNVSRYRDNDNEESQIGGDQSLDSHSQCSGDTSTTAYRIFPHHMLPLTTFLSSNSPSER